MNTKKLTGKQMLFVKNISKGMTQKDAAINSGYSISSAEVVASRLMRNEKIIHALEAHGLTDDYLAKKLKQNIEAGTGVKATAETALRAIEITSKIKGYMNTNDDSTKNLTQNNLYIQLQGMTENELNDKVKSLLHEVTVISS